MTNRDYIRGEWAGYNRVLALLQTYDTRMISKADLYQEIMELRPLGDRPLEPDDDIDTSLSITTKETNMSDTDNTEAETEIEEVIVPDGHYALTFNPQGQIKVIVPTLADDEPMTNGHILMLGLSMLLNEPGWAENTIKKTEKKLQALRAAAEAGNISIDEPESEDADPAEA